MKASSTADRANAWSRRDFLQITAGAGTALALSGCRTATGGDLEFWSQLAGSKKKAGQALEQAFDQTRPANQVSTSLYGSPDQLNQKLLTGIVGGVLPDLFVQHWDYSVIYASGDKLSRLDDVLDPATLDPRFAGFSTYRGGLVTAPLYGTSRALTINTDLARQAGLNPSAPPRSWEDLRQWAVAMTHWDGDRLLVAGLQLYGSDLELFEMFTVLLQGAGGSLLSPDRSDVTFDSPAGVEAVEFLRALVLDDRVTTPGFGIGDSAASSPITSGRAGMSLNGNYGLTALETAKVDYVVAPFPQRDSGFTSLIDPFCFGVPVGAKQPDAAKRFVSFAMTLDQQVAFATASRNVPALLNAQQADALTKDKGLAAFVDAARYAPESAPTTPGFTRLTPVVARAIQNVFYERDTSLSALRSAAEQLRPVVARGARL